ncbi:MAG: hypothetical protein GTN68_37810 [Candidatus Aminicenantes bacterium]|nr:hypothetical protein [Candidatus Aminicenantes bacterium]
MALKIEPARAGHYVSYKEALAAWHKINNQLTEARTALQIERAAHARTREKLNKLKRR